jgi:hypothetical protein
MSTPRQTADSNDNSVKEEIIGLERRRCDAYLRRDLKALDELLPDHFTFTRPSGIVLNKRQLLAALDAGEMIFESFDRQYDDINVYLNTAVAIGCDTVKGSYQGRDLSGQYRFSNMYVERAGHWMVVATHASRLAVAES